MKQVVMLFLVVSGFTGIFNSCRKTGFTSDPNARLSISIDTLSFDSVFATTGSVTRSFKIFNNNDQKLRISEIRLMGNNSPFRINVDGQPGTSFSNLELEANDSIYVFVSVKVDSTGMPANFLASDSIRIAFNQNVRQVQLNAQVRKARFLKNTTIINDSTWTNDLPIVVLGELKVNGNLTINAGTLVYCHADAPIIVNGSITTNGTLNSKVIFRGDRLDEPYRYYPASWPGIILSQLSSGSFQHTEILNAYQGIVAAPLSSLQMNKCVVDNCYDAGIIGSNATITAENCLVSNCGTNVALLNGGQYNLNHCTLASIGNYFLQHRNPVLSISNFLSGQTPNPLNVNFTNSIMYGEGGITENEVVVQRHSATTGLFQVSFTNILYKNKQPLSGTGITLQGNVILNEKPEFDTVDVAKNKYNFRLKSSSPAIGKGSITTATSDLDDKQRDSNPDLGSYEFNP